MNKKRYPNFLLLDFESDSIPKYLEINASTVKSAKN